MNFQSAIFVFLCLLLSKFQVECISINKGQRALKNDKAIGRTASTQVVPLSKDGELEIKAEVADKERQIMNIKLNVEDKVQNLSYDREAQVESMMILKEDEQSRLKDQQEKDIITHQKLNEEEIKKEIMENNQSIVEQENINKLIIEEQVKENEQHIEELRSSQSEEISELEVYNKVKLQEFKESNQLELKEKEEELIEELNAKTEMLENKLSEIKLRQAEEFEELKQLYKDKLINIVDENESKQADANDEMTYALETIEDEYEFEFGKVEKLAKKSEKIIGEELKLETLETSKENEEMRKIVESTLEFQREVSAEERMLEEKEKEKRLAEEKFKIEELQNQVETKIKNEHQSNIETQILTDNEIKGKRLEFANDVLIEAKEAKEESLMIPNDPILSSHTLDLNTEKNELKKEGDASIASNATLTTQENLNTDLSINTAIVPKSEELIVSSASEKIEATTAVAVQTTSPTTQEAPKTDSLVADSNSNAIKLTDTSINNPVQILEPSTSPQVDSNPRASSTTPTIPTTETIIETQAESVKPVSDSPTLAQSTTLEIKEEELQPQPVTNSETLPVHNSASLIQYKITLVN